MKMKVLAIAPYEGLAELLLKVSADYANEMEITIMVGDLQEGLQHAMNAQEQGYDVIVSRGGTTTLIMNHVNIPVINIEVSGYDYMRAIKTAENFKGKRAIVGFSYITNNARSVNELLQTDIAILTIQEKEEIAPILTQLSEEGYTLVIGDVSTVRVAKQTHIIGMLLNSGEESVRQAFEDALNAFHSIVYYKRQVHLLSNILNAMDNQIVVFNVNHHLVYVSDAVQSDVLLPQVKTYIDAVLNNGTQDIRISEKNYMYDIKGVPIIDVDETKSALFVIHKSKALSQLKERGLDVVVRAEEQWEERSFVKEIQRYGERINQEIISYTKSLENIMLIGEPGVGKRKLVDNIHRYCGQKHSFLLAFDCSITKKGFVLATLKEQDWIQNQSEHIIYFHEIQRLRKEEQLELYDLLTTDERFRSVRLIASAIGNVQQLLELGRIQDKLFYLIAKCILQIPSLNEMKDEIDSIANVYLIEANTKYGKQVVGFTNEAIALLKGHKWHYHYTELRNVINQAVLSCVSSYIQASQFEMIFETLRHSSSHKQEEIVLQGTLENMEKDAIQKAIELENGSLTKAAKRLGISRSTLWRKMKAE